MTEAECWSLPMFLTMRWGKGRSLFSVSHMRGQEIVSKYSESRHRAKSCCEDLQLCPWLPWQDITSHPTFESAAPFCPRPSEVRMISEGVASYDGADKLRTCKVCVCNASVTVIRPEQMSAQSKQLQTMSVRELWRQAEYGERGPTEKAVWFAPAVHRQQNEEGNVLSESTVCTWQRCVSLRVCSCVSVKPCCC